MPIHEIGQEKKKGAIGSPYAVRDYYSINPDYGTKADLQRLIKEAHKHGQKVIIDIVANHTSWDSVMMKHPDFYKHDAQGKIIFPYDWSDQTGSAMILSPFDCNVQRRAFRSECSKASVQKRAFRKRAFRVPTLVGQCLAQSTPPF